MTAPPKNLPRFLPTLTERVDPSGSAAVSVPLAPEMEEIVQSVMQQMHRLIENRLAEEIDAVVRTLVVEQLQSLRLRLRQEFELGVRQAVIEAITRRSEAQKQK